MQELLGVVADLTWSDAKDSLQLTAACSLPANLPLTAALTAVGADPEHLIMTHGLPALAWAQQAQQKQGAAQLPPQGQGTLPLPWQEPDAACFQLCIEPPEEDECRAAKLQLLAASALGTSHALTVTTSKVTQIFWCGKSTKSFTRPSLHFVADMQMSCVLLKAQQLADLKCQKYAHVSDLHAVFI